MRPLWSVISVLRGGANKGWTLVTAFHSLFYPLFEWLVWRRFGEQIKAGNFDVVHRVTPLSPTAPSLLARRCARAGVPFVVGPLNGGVPWPKGFDKERRKEREWLSYVRRVYKFLPGARSTWRNAAAIIVGSLHTRWELPSGGQSKTTFIPENGINPKAFVQSIDRSRYDGINLCFIGRLVPYKGPDIALDAAQELLRSGRAHFTIIGDGPLMQPLKEQAARLGISAAVEFCGWVPHAKIPSLATRSNIFLFPSIREFGGGAVIEAMALGLVPIVVDYGGPGEIVTNDTGFRVRLGSRQSLVKDTAALLADLSERRYDLAGMAKAGLERVNALYTWEQKALQITQVYDWVCHDREDRPTFPFIPPDPA
jgi:glycosyltransferase involved in cell wall biosynthesis